MVLGKMIQKLRKDKNLSQEQLAEMLGVTRQSISKWELEEAVPDVSYIIKLSELFSMSVDELLKGEKTDKKDSSSHNNVKDEMVLEGKGMTMKMSKGGNMEMHMDGMPGMVMNPMNTMNPMDTMNLMSTANLMKPMESAKVQDEMKTDLKFSSIAAESEIELEKGAEILSQQQSTNQNIETISIRYRIHGEIHTRTIVKKDGKIIADIPE